MKVVLENSRYRYVVIFHDMQLVICLPVGTHNHGQTGTKIRVWKFRPERDNDDQNKFAGILHLLLLGKCWEAAR